VLDYSINILVHVFPALSIFFRCFYWSTLYFR